jgi:sulfonate transport system permease protein
VVATLFGMIVSGELPDNLFVFLRVAVGLSIGVSFGIVLALVAGLSKGRGGGRPDHADQAHDPHAGADAFVHRVVWHWRTPKVALIAFATIFPVYLNLYAGIRGVDVRLIEGARSFGLSKAEVIWHVVLPGALPALLTGLRYSLSVSILVLVVAEQINASAGLGYLVNNARDFMRTDIIVVCLLVYAALGLGADGLVRLIERRALAWRPSLVEA